MKISLLSRRGHKTGGSPSKKIKRYRLWFNLFIFSTVIISFSLLMFSDLKVCLLFLSFVFLTISIICKRDIDKQKRSKRVFDADLTKTDPLTQFIIRSTFGTKLDSFDRYVLKEFKITLLTSAALSILTATSALLLFFFPLKIIIVPSVLIGVVLVLWSTRKRKHKPIESPEGIVIISMEEKSKETEESEDKGEIIH